MLSRVQPTANRLLAAINSYSSTAKLIGIVLFLTRNSKKKGKKEGGEDSTDTVTFFCWMLGVLGEDGEGIGLWVSGAVSRPKFRPTLFSSACR